MVNLKKYNVLSRHFVLFLTFLVFAACGSQHNTITEIKGKQIGITDKSSQTPAIEDFVKPYREKLDADLNTVLAIAPETIDKIGEWQSPMGNFMADVTLKKGDSVFIKRENKHIDICLLNHGGIRAIIPKGDITTRTAFEIMPFENSLIVIAMKGEQIKEIADYIIKEKKPHPLSGMGFTIDKSGQSKNILVQGKPLEMGKTYYVATSDYLSNGGDNMVFFKKNTGSFDMEYKLRDILIDYFKEVKIVPLISDKRIIVE
ncbi:5'-nucleotidase C-terminal domain-containing protein [Flavobacterium sp. 3HN19-14]|uniref:5'-nucleotidase C-terminal domain-containing protein n=1 Tax=Flavobacterium sp. 3HN19-14 TaxID=3448133 RepID=UPI003EE14DC6